MQNSMTRFRWVWVTLVLVYSSLGIAQSQPGSLNWPLGSAGDSGVSPSKLESMEAAVRSGAFTKIGSVLIARYGKLVYEVYFEGTRTPAATLALPPRALPMCWLA